MLLRINRFLYRIKYCPCKAFPVFNRISLIICDQALYYLSGLTCTDENVVQKGFIQRAAATRGLIIVAPDTR